MVIEPFSSVADAHWSESVLGDDSSGALISSSKMGKLQLIREKSEMRQWTRSMKKDGRRVALVPTMGYLHEGHLALVREAQARSDLVVVSIYVNPGQFAPGEDLSIYPRNLEGDLAKLEVECSYPTLS